MTRPPFSPGPPRGRRYNSDTGRPALNWDSARTYLDSLPLPPVYQRLNERTVPVLIRSTPGDDLLSISAWVRDITDAWVLVQYSPRIERHSGVSYLRVMEVDDLASWASTRYPSRSRIPLPSRFLDHPPSPSHLDPRSPTRGRSPPLRTGRHSPLEHRHHSYLSENLRETGSQVRQRREPIGHTTYLNRTNRRTNLIRSDDSAPLQSSFRRDSDPPPPYPNLETREPLVSLVPRQAIRSVVSSNRTDPTPTATSSGQPALDPLDILRPSASSTPHHTTVRGRSSRPPSHLAQDSSLRPPVTSASAASRLGRPLADRHLSTLSASPPSVHPTHSNLSGPSAVRSSRFVIERVPHDPRGTSLDPTSFSAVREQSEQNSPGPVGSSAANSSRVRATSVTYRMYDPRKVSTASPIDSSDDLSAHRTKFRLCLPPTPSGSSGTSVGARAPYLRLATLEPVHDHAALPSANDMRTPRASSSEALSIPTPTVSVPSPTPDLRNRTHLSRPSNSASSHLTPTEVSDRQMDVEEANTIEDLSLGEFFAWAEISVPNRQRAALPPPEEFDWYEDVQGQEASRGSSPRVISGSVENVQSATDLQDTSSGNLIDMSEPGQVPE